MGLLGFGVGVVDPSGIFCLLENQDAEGEREILGWVQGGPFNSTEGVSRLPHFKSPGKDGDVQGSVVILVKVEPQTLEKRLLHRNGSPWIAAVPGLTRSHTVALNDSSINGFQHGFLFVARFLWTGDSFRPPFYGRFLQDFLLE